MRKNMMAISVLTGLLAGITSLPAQTDARKVVSPPLPEVRAAKVERAAFDNGMVVFLLEDHELPLVELSAIIGTGSVDDPPDKVGLASICEAVMRTGGSTATPGDKMDETLEALAASVEVYAGVTTSSARVSALKENFDQALGLFVQVLTAPAFPEAKIELAKIEHHGSIERRNDEPFGIASREFSKVVYGAASPYARQEEHAGIDAINRADLVDFHRRFFRPNNLMLAVSGDFEAAAMRAKLQRVFADWKPGDFKRRPAPEVPHEFSPSVNLVKKSDIHQAHIWIGHLAGMMKDPDYPALTVMQEIFGSGFTSRLFTTVRSRMGLSYNVWGAYGCNYDYPGMFSATCQTKAESMSVALDAIKKEIAKLTSEPVTEAELQLAKDRYLNTFVFQFDTPGEIVQRHMTYEYYGYPADFLEATKARVEKVSREDILAAAKKHLRPEALRILVLGNPEKFDQPASRYGEVNEIDITIPGRPAQGKAAL